MADKADKKILETSTEGGWLDNLLKRVLTGIPALIILLLLIALIAPVLLAGILLLCSVYGLYEYRRMLAGPRRIRLSPGLLLIGTVLIFGGGFWWGPDGLSGMFVLAAFLVIGVGLVQSEQSHGETMEFTMFHLLGLMWIPWFLGHLVLVLELPGGRGLITFLVLVLTFNDTFAYLAGSLLGRRVLFKRLSRKKTLAGSVGGIGGAVLAGAIASLWLAGGEFDLSLPQVLLLSVPLAILGQAGDYFESLLKRFAGVESSGSFLPGHGGFLDRLDAFLLTAPFLYYFLVLTAP